MNQQMLISVVTSLLMTALGGVAVKLGIDASTWAVVIGAVATLLVALAIAVWRAALRSPNAIIAEAAKIIAPDGGVIQTTPELAAKIPAANVIAKPADPQP